jgi:hypothetical protein
LTVTLPILIYISASRLEQIPELEIYLFNRIRDTTFLEADFEAF